MPVSATPFPSLPRASRRRSRARRWALLAGSLATLAAHAQPADELFTLSLEELSSVSISAAAKRSQPLFETPAAVSVLLGADLQRFGHGSIADALRAVPGVHVAEQRPQRWGVGVRGFNAFGSSKLLVLVDGRSVYSPYSAGVDWLDADVPLADLARIEVVRGPGSSLWGANAVNGVINIIPRDARDTQGGILTVRGGIDEASDAYLRYGGRMGDTWFRVYAGHTEQEFDLGERQSEVPRSGTQDFGRTRAGFRTDTFARAGWQLSFSGEFTRIEQAVTTPTDLAPTVFTQRHADRDTAHLLTRFTTQPGGDAEFTAQFYIDWLDDRADPTFNGSQTEMFRFPLDGTTFDLDLTYHVRRGRHDVVLGGGGRSFRGELAPDQVFRDTVRTYTREQLNIFAQDEIAFFQEQLRLTLGAKLEWHDTVALQFLPSVRLAYVPAESFMLWAAFTESVRAPSQLERAGELVITDLPPTYPYPGLYSSLRGLTAFREERLRAYEAGVRFLPDPAVQLEVTAYLHDYSGLRNFSAVAGFDPATATALYTFWLENSVAARGYGTEASARWRVSPTWELTAGAALAWVDAAVDSPLPFLVAEYEIPKLSWHLRSWWQLPRDLELSAALYAVDELPGQAPANLRGDVSVLWRPRPDWSFQAGVQNAFDPGHREHGSADPIWALEVPRVFFGRMEWRF